MRNLLLTTLFVFVGCGQALKTSDSIASGVIVTSASSRPDYPVQSTIDGIYSSFMTTYTLNMSDTVEINYEFPSLTLVNNIDLVNDYTNSYCMGDLTILVSQDGSTWETIEQMDATNNGFLNGDGNVVINRNVKHLRLKMEYYGTGAYGSTPSFYLSEIIFH